MNAQLPTSFDVPEGIFQERLDLDGVRFWRIDTATQEERWASIFPASKGFTVTMSGYSEGGHRGKFSDALRDALEHVTCQSDAEWFAALKAEVAAASPDKRDLVIERQRAETSLAVETCRNIQRPADLAAARERLASVKAELGEAS